MTINEDFLWFVWKYKVFPINELQTIDGKPIEIIQTGLLNTNAGPDFINSQVRIGQTHWAGNVEIHCKTSDWNQHGHSADPAYKNVILHVVYEHDGEEIDNIPVLALKEYVPEKIVDTFFNWKNTTEWVPCASQVHLADEFTKNIWLSRMLTERLETKSLYIQKLLEKNKNDWSETFYQLLARNFGFKINAEPFERLATSIPLKILARHKNNHSQIEAMVFGQAGFLDGEFTEYYPVALKKEFNFLSGKYSLLPLEKHEWKFLRLHPRNFPAYRLSQFASLIFRSNHLFSHILEVKSLKEAKALFDVSASDYWISHYNFEKESARKVKPKLGKASIDIILINTAIPMLFTYAKLRELPDLQAKALEWLEQLKPEKNNITKGWEKLGFLNDSAYQSQALIHLKNEFCSKFKCLECGIGVSILRKN